MPNWPAPLARNATLRGVVRMVMAMSCIGIVDALAKVLGDRLSGIQVAWGYFVCMWLALVLLSSARGTHPISLVRTRNPQLQWARAACLVMSLSLLFTALRHLPLAEATTISFTAPLFVVALAGPVLRHRMAVNFAARADGITVEDIVKRLAGRL